MKGLYPVSLACEVLEVSASGYFNWLRQRHSCCSGPSGRHSDEALLAHIRAIHAQVKGEYGWPRMHKELLTRGIRVGKDRVRRLMQQHGIKARTKRKFVVTTDSRHSLPVAPDLVQRRFNPEQPNELWSGDITYIATDEGWLYLAAVIDLFSRQVVGWSLQPHMQASLVKDALAMAWWRRRPPAGLIFQSDLGSQYCSHEFQEASLSRCCPLGGAQHAGRGDMLANGASLHIPLGLGLLGASPGGGDAARRDPAGQAQQVLRRALSTGL